MTAPKEKKSAPRTLSVLAATNRKLAEIRVIDKALAQSALAATAQKLAVELDGDNSATSKALCSKALTEVLEKLSAQLPAKKETDDVAKLQAGG